jgi:hypothetical protein
MSPTLQQKIGAWAQWIVTNKFGVGNLTLVGFEHQCGAFTPFSPSLSLFDTGELDIPSCSGCRFELARPQECTPLYKRR